jgi:hypothetical protein
MTVVVREVKFRPMGLHYIGGLLASVIPIHISLVRPKLQGLSHIAHTGCNIQFSYFPQVHFTVIVHHNKKQQPLRLPALCWLQSMRVYTRVCHAQTSWCSGSLDPGRI